MATSSSSTVPGVPDLILKIHGFMCFFNADTRYAVHSECIDGIRFVQSWVVFGVALSAILVQATLFGVKWFVMRAEALYPPEERQILHVKYQFPHTQKLCFLLLSSIYPLVSQHVMRLLHCDEALPPDGKLHMVHGVKVTRVLFGQFNEDGSPQIVRVDQCWDTEHKPVAAMAVFMLLVYILGYPIASFVGMRSVYKEIGKSTERMQRWSHFISDYLPDRFWFRHVTWMLVLLMVITLEWMEPGPARSSIIIVMLLGFSVALIKLAPFPKADLMQGLNHRWKLPVRLALVNCSIVSELLDAVVYRAEQSGEGTDVPSCRCLSLKLEH